MQLLKKTTLGGVALLFVTTLFLFGLSFGLLQVFGNPDSIKSALKRSGIYQSVIESALEQAQKNQDSSGEDKIPLDRPEVQNIIKTAASPELLQSKTENALDAVYAWVHGQTPNLEFRLETADIKANLANGLEQYVAQHVAALPVCASGAAGSAADDPFNATCRPAGADPNQLASQAKSEFLNGEFLQDTTLSADTIKTGDGQTLAQKAENVPSMYEKISWSVYGSGIFAALLAIGVVFLSATWRSGLKKVSIIFIVVGAVSIAVSWLVGLGINRAAEFAKEPLQQSAVKVVDALAGNLRGWWMWYGIVLLVVGIATLVVLRFTSKTAEGPTEPGEQTGEELPESPTAASTTPRPPIPPKPPKPVKKLVQ